MWGLCPLKHKVPMPAVGSGRGRCLESFIPVRFCPWSRLDLLVFPSQTPEFGFYKDQFHRDTAVPSPVPALLGHGPRFWGAIKLWAKPGRGAGANKLLSLFPHSVWERWWPVKNTTFSCQERETEAQQCVCGSMSALELHLSSQTLPLFLINMLRNFKM